MRKHPKRKLNNACVATIEQIERRLLMSTYTVNTLSDAAMPVTGLLTLRQAVADANAHAGADTIDFSSSIFQTTSVNTISMSQGEIDFTDTSGATTLNGPGSAALVVSGAQLSRVFGVSSSVTVLMNGLTITGGDVTSTAPSAAMGGGIENAGSLSLTNVIVSNNTATGGDSETNGVDGQDPVNAGAAFGGGIYSTGSLTLIGSTVSGNTAAGGNTAYESHGGDASGGGIYSTGTLTVTGSSILANNASGGTTNQSLIQNGGDAQGGGIFCSGQTNLGSSKVSNNSTNGGEGFFAGVSYGGGFYFTAASTLTGDTFNDNQAYGGGDNSTEGGGGGNASGGAVFSTAAIAISSSTLTGNTATGGFGTNQDYGFAGNGSGGAIAALSNLTISNSTVSTNTATGGPTGNGYNADADSTDAAGIGGGIYATQLLEVTNCTVNSNKAQGASGGTQVDPDNGGPAEAGGIATFGTGTISDSTISSNTAIGGVAYPAETTSDARYQSGDAEGGGVFNGGNLKVVSSTLDENQATGGAGFVAVQGVNSYYNGDAGNAAGGGIFSSSTLTVENSTLSANSATGGVGPDGNQYAQNAGNGGNGEGGGIYSMPLLTLFDSTVVQNTVTASSGGAGFTQNGYTGTNGTSGVAEGGGIFAGSNSLVDNSILSANTGASGADVYSTLSSSSSHNLIGYGGGLTNGDNGNLIGIHNPMLGTLADNGGPTFTMLPIAGSPVINAGLNTLIPSGITTDQRGAGFSRIVNSVVDIGAVEYPAETVITVTPPASQTAVAGQSSSISPGSFAESNAIGPFTVTLIWGDGSANSVFSMTAAGTIPAQSHTYSSVGNDTVTVSVIDASGESANSQTFSVAVSAVQVKASTTSLSASANLSLPGNAITFTATVTGNAGSTPTGSVNFSLNGSVLGSGTLNNGHAMFTTSSLPVGTDLIIARYSGNNQYPTSSSSPISVTVQEPSKIVSAFVRPTFNTTAVAGAKLKARLPLSLTNSGAAIKGVFKINYYANTAAGLDGNQVLLTSLTKNISLGTGKSTTITAVVKSLPSTLPDGSYYLLAEVTDPSNLISVAATSTTIAVTAPSISLAATVGAVTPANLTARKSGSISITIKNNGNIAASGLLALSINPSINTTVLTPAIASYRARTSIAAGKSRTFRIRVKPPSSLTPGTYFPAVSITIAGSTLTAIGSTAFTIA